MAVERDGLLEDPSYIEGLPDDSPLKQHENVFMFSMHLASMELQKLVHLVGGMGGVSPPCEERYVFPASTTELMNGKCKATCQYPNIVGLGEKAGHPGTK